MWWDAALRSGETFDEVIEKELRAAKAVVVLWSTAFRRFALGAGRGDPG